MCTHMSHLLKNTDLSLDEGVLDTGPVLANQKNWLIVMGVRAGKGSRVLRSESNNAAIRLFSYCSLFDKC